MKFLLEHTRKEDALVVLNIDVDGDIEILVNDMAIGWIMKNGKIVMRSLPSSESEELALLGFAVLNHNVVVECD